MKYYVEGSNENGNWLATKQEGFIFSTEHRGEAVEYRNQLNKSTRDLEMLEELDHSVDLTDTYQIGYNVVEIDWI